MLWPVLLWLRANFSTTSPNSSPNFSPQKPTNTMAAISMPIAARAEYALHQLAKREKNWAQREPGVIVVLVIVFLVAILVIAMFINKKVRRTTFATT
jgi:hypothetical protein